MNKLVLFLFVSFGSIAQSDRLSELIDERKILYAEWNEALDKKSGFFGKQNKDDLEEINTVLKKIIKKDNEIIKAIEDSKLNQYGSLQEKFNQLIDENEQLSKQKNAMERKLLVEKEYQNANHSQIERAEGDKILVGLLCLLFIIITIVLFRNLSKTRKKLRALEGIIKNSKL
ncbi:MAG: hypothetical protein V4683_03670 [Bacteroidota bacterium]